MKKEKISCIYEIRNTVNNKIYIGSTIDFKQRSATHKSKLRKNKHHSIILQNAWNKYGQDNFVFNIIENVPSELLQEIEQKYINEQNPSYNIGKIVGAAMTGRKHSKESIDKIKRAGIGHIVTQECKNLLKNKFSGDRSSSAKLTWEEVAQIRKLRKDNRASTLLLAKQFNINRKVIEEILKNTIWIDPTYTDIYSNIKTKFSEKDILDIQTSALSILQLANLYESSYETIWAIKKGKKNYKNRGVYTNGN